MRPINCDEDDLHSVALCAWKEARGDGITAMDAVMHVIANRVGTPGFASDVHGVVYGKNQFTSMSVPSDPEFNLEPKVGDSLFNYCMSKVAFVMNGTDQDLTMGACYYDNPATATSGWFLRVIVNDTVNHPFLIKIGKQNFYR
jgi:spore germination cell wall hydrolase CwlJ-like protein